MPLFLLTVRVVFTKQLSARWAIVQLAGRRILVPLIVVQVHVAQPTRTPRRPHRLAGPGQRPFTPSTAVQIRLGTPKISIGYSSSVLGLQKLGYNFSSGDLLLRNFCFKQVFHYLPDAAASQSRKNFALVRVQTRALRIAVRGGRPIMSHENLGGIQT